MSYHARDPVWGLGFSETRLAPDVWRVMYRGYYIPEAQAGDYAMLRAAEVVRAAGYRYFVVENERSSATVMGSDMATSTRAAGRHLLLHTAIRKLACW